MLLDRATRANEKAGPFEALFVVGSVSESEEEAFLKRSKKGESQQQQRAGAGSDEDVRSRSARRGDGWKNGRK